MKYWKVTVLAALLSGGAGLGLGSIAQHLDPHPSWPVRFAVYFGLSLVGLAIGITLAVIDKRRERRRMAAYVLWRTKPKRRL